MNKMPWLDSLNEQQMQIANMIVDKAEKEGVDPKLALSIAFQESKLSHGSFQKDKDGKLAFRPTTGTSGEIGLMQVMPTTAEQYGYKREDLQSLEKNLEIGVRILKSHMDRFGDPRKAAAAYNAGAGRANNPPDSTKNYVTSVQGLGGFEPTSEPAASAASAASEPPQTTEPSVYQPIPLGGGDQGAPVVREPSFKENLEEQIPRLAGAGAGATAATSLAMGKKAVSGAGLMADYMRSQIAARQAPPAMPGAPTMPGAPPSVMTQAPQAPIPSGGPDAGRLVRGQTGTMPYNYGKAAGLTDIEAGRALDMTKQTGGVHDLTTQRREALNKLSGLFPNDRYVENPRFGGLMTPDSSVGSGPRQSFVRQGPLRDVPPGTIFGPAAPPPEGTLRQLPPRAPVPTTPPPLSLLDEAIAKLGQIARGGLRVLSSAPVAGGLGGYGAVMSAEDVMKRRKEGDTLGATIAGIGTAGGVLAAVPHPLAKGAGLTASVMSPLALMALDRMRKSPEQQIPQPATP
jgi:hypothetical protein